MDIAADTGGAHLAQIGQTAGAHGGVRQQERGPFGHGLPGKSCQFGGGEEEKGGPSTMAAIGDALFEGAPHFGAEPGAVVAGVEAKQQIPGGPHKSYYASRDSRRASAARVNCRMRSNSRCRRLRPTGVIW